MKAIAELFALAEARLKSQSHQKAPKILTS